MLEGLQADKRSDSDDDLETTMQIYVSELCDSLSKRGSGSPRCASRPQSSKGNRMPVVSAPYTSTACYGPDSAYYVDNLDRWSSNLAELSRTESQSTRLHDSFVFSSSSTTYASTARCQEVSTTKMPSPRRGAMSKITNGLRNHPRYGKSAGVSDVKLVVMSKTQQTRMAVTKSPVGFGARFGKDNDCDGPLLTPKFCYVCPVCCERHTKYRLVELHLRESHKPWFDHFCMLNPDHRSENLADLLRRESDTIRLMSSFLPSASSTPYASSEG